MNNSNQKLIKAFGILMIPIYLLLLFSIVYVSSVYLRLAFLLGFSAFFYTYIKFKTKLNKKTDLENSKDTASEERVHELEKLLTEQKKISQELTKSKERFREAAFYDKLTHLPNRNYVIDTLESLLSINQANTEYKFGILYLDLNEFKNINDSLGHSFGDELLIKVSKRLADNLDDSCILAHFGSDEFAVVMTDVSDKESVIKQTEKIYEEIEKPFVFDERQVYTDFSAGIVYSENLYDNVEEILRDADIAMYQAKKLGKPFIIFDRSMYDSVMERIQIETDLRKAIDRQEFSLQYQPLIDLKTLKLIGFESLVRWEHPQKGLVRPNDFISVAEDTGLIVPISEWVLYESCRQIKLWQEQFDSELIISVNLSRKHLTDSNLIENIKDVLQKTNFDSSKLKMEITEGAVMEDAETAIETLEKLKSLDIQLSIDDFGTGYSSLSYLHKFPINTIKIDRSFVKIIEQDGSNDEMVKTIITMAKSLNLDLIAEGIEEVAQFQKLQSLQCEYGQGYLFSPPLSPNVVENLLTDKSLWKELKDQNDTNFIPKIQEMDSDNSIVN